MCEAPIHRKSAREAFRPFGLGAASGLWRKAAGQTLTYIKGWKHMSIVIVGGNECMTRRYMDLCGEFNCKAKVYPKTTSGLKNIGSPDLLVLFTNTVSHKMVRCALNETKGGNTRIARSHRSSMAALRSILEAHVC